MSRDISKLGAPEQSNGMREAVLAAARDGRSSPTRAVGRRVRAMLFAAGGAGVLVAAALFLLFRPTTAQAALQRVIAASEAVRTCHMEFVLAMPGSPKETRVSWYANGKWRFELWRGDTQQEVTVYDGARRHFYNAGTNQVHLNASNQPFGTEFEGFTVAAMLKHMGDAEIEADQLRQDGRILDRFTITRFDDEREVVLADPSTNLPVSIDAYGRVDNDWEKLGYTEVIEYNVPIDPGLFVLTAPEGATVVDEEALKAEWQRRFDAGMARVTDGDQEAVLRDFQVTTEGDVLVIWTAGFPSINHSAALTDSLGTTYLDAQDRGYFQTKGWPCAWFIPVTPPAHRPATYVLTVTNGHHTYTFRVNKPIFSGSPDPVYPGFKVERGAPAFLFPWGVYGEIERAEIRAAYWKSQGDARKALQYYERQTALSDEEVHRFYVPATTWLDIGTLYEQTGQRAKAHDAYQRGLECHRRDSDRRNEWEQRVAEKLEQGLRRTR
jgi:outer membrane lipoprotein-sorting protein